MEETKDVGKAGAILSIPHHPNIRLTIPSAALLKTCKISLKATPWHASIKNQLADTMPMALSPIVTIEPVRRKFHSSLSLHIEVPSHRGKENHLHIFCNFYPLDSEQSTESWQDVTKSVDGHMENNVYCFKTTVSANFCIVSSSDINDELTHKMTELFISYKKKKAALAIPDTMISNYMTAASNGDLNKLKHCLDVDDVPVDCMSENGLFALYMAAQEGHTDIVQYLIENGANLCAVTRDGFHTLDVALQENRRDIITFLLEVIKEGNTPEVLQLLSNNKVVQKSLKLSSPAEKDKDFIQSAGKILISAAAKNLKIDLDSIQQVTKTETKSYLLAAYDGNVENVKGYIMSGNECFTSTERKMTALHCACLTGQVEIVKILIDHKHPVNIKTKSGITPLFLAVQEGESDVVKILLSHKADPNMGDENDLQPLMVARVMGHTDLVEMLRVYV